jgi:hypothetical protein
MPSPTFAHALSTSKPRSLRDPFAVRALVADCINGHPKAALRGSEIGANDVEGYDAIVGRAAWLGLRLRHLPLLFLVHAERLAQSIQDVRRP